MVRKHPVTTFFIVLSVLSLLLAAVLGILSVWMTGTPYHHAVGVAEAALYVCFGLLSAAAIAGVGES